MFKTIKTAAIKEPGNYWIIRRVWQKNGKEYIKLNGDMVSLDWLYVHGWHVDIDY